MYTGFNLRIDKNASIFEGPNNYKRLQEIGENHLNDQKTVYENNLKN